MSEMGTLRTIVGVQNVSQRGEIRELPETLVDTGSEFTWIPRPILEALDIRVQRRQGFLLADGRRVDRDIGYAIIHAGGAATADDVVFGEDTDFILVGVRSLEGPNLRLDVVRKQLVDAGPILAVALTHS